MDRISLSNFVSHVFYAVRRVFIFFEAEKYDEVYKELQDLKEFVELKYDKVYDWGYSCAHIPYRTSNAAMDREILKEIVEIAKTLSEGFDQKKQQVLSQNLWILIDGWDIPYALELFVCRTGIKLQVKPQTEGVTSERLEEVRREKGE